MSTDVPQRRMINPKQPPPPQKLQSMKTQHLRSLKSMLDAPATDDDSIVDLDYEKDLNTIDYDRMQDSLKKTHVVKPDGKYYSVKEACWNFNAGSHSLVKSSENSDLTKFGVGIMLYFKFVKHLMIFFFLFTLLSIPAFVFYISAYVNYSTSSDSSVSYTDALAATTVGAVGIDGSSCSMKKMPGYTANSDKTQLYFQCPTGTISSVEKMIYGLVSPGSTCNLIQTSDLITSCNDYSYLDTYFLSCVGQSSCTITIPLQVFKYGDSTCSALYDKKNVYMKVGCDTDSITIAGNLVSKSAVAYVVAAFDAVIIIIFIVMIYTLKYAQKNAIQNVQKKSYSASSYTVEFRNLPQDMPAEELSAKLWVYLDGKLGEKFFQEGHRVIDVQIILPNKLIEYSKNAGTLIHTKNTLVREFMQTYCPDYTKHEINLNGLQEIMKSMLEQNHPQLSKAEKIFKNIKDLSAKKMKLLAEIQRLKTSTDVRIVSAFVTFSSISARNKILDTFISSPLDRFSRILSNRFYDKDILYYCIRDFADVLIRFSGKILTVRSSADPGSILWENLGEPGMRIFLRRAFSWTLTIVLWLIAATILIVATYYKDEFNDAFPSIDCSGSLKDVSDATAATDYGLGEYQVGLLQCYCTADFAGRLSHVFTTYNNEKLCVTWWTSKVLGTCISFAIVFVVLIINYFLQLVFQGLSKFEKHSTLNKQLATRVIKTFSAQFLNTGLLILAVNAKIGKISFWQGKFDDLSPLWYVNVGSTLLSTMLINVITVPTVKIGAVLAQKLARFYDRGWKSDPHLTKQKNQKSYEELYSGPEFIIDFRYTQILTLTFVCFLYSGGMPFLYVTSFLQLLFTYFFDKIFLLKVSKIPKNYDEKLETVVRPTLYITLIIHLIFTIFMLGNSDIFTQSSTFSSVNSAITDSISQSNENDVTKFFRRTVLDHNIVLLVLLILIIVIFLVKGVLVGLLRRIVFAIFTKDESKTRKKGGKVAPDAPAHYTFFHVLKIEDIATLIRLTKVTMKTTQNPELIKLLNAKLELLKQEYQTKQQNHAKPVNFIGFYTYDVRLQPSYADQFAIQEMLDDEHLG